MQGIVGAMGVGNTGPNFINSLYEAGKKEGVPNFLGTLSAVGGGILKGYFRDALRDSGEERWRIHNLIANSEGAKKEEWEGVMKELLSELYIEADNKSLREDLQAIRGPKALNLMFATQNYDELARTAVDEGVDLIVTGAGPALRLPKIISADSDVLLGAIVNGGRTAEKYCKSWGKYGHSPDVIIGEGPKAGGHDAYTLEQLADPDFVEKGLEKIFREIVQATKGYSTIRGESIPILLAGGAFYGGDMKKILSWEEDGIKPLGLQMSTRWLCASDASDEHKQACIDADERSIIKSPVGYPGSAIENEFIRKVREGERHPTGCAYHCLRTCNPDEAPYCIAKALINTRNGNVDEGVLFAGYNVKHCSNENFRRNGRFTNSEEVSRDLAREYRVAAGSS